MSAYRCNSCDKAFKGRTGCADYLNHREAVHGDLGSLEELLNLSLVKYDDYYLRREVEHGIRLTEQYLKENDVF